MQNVAFVGSGAASIGATRVGFGFFFPHRLFDTIGDGVHEVVGVGTVRVGVGFVDVLGDALGLTLVGATDAGAPDDTVPALDPQAASESTTAPATTDTAQVRTDRRLMSALPLERSARSECAGT